MINEEITIPQSYTHSIKIEDTAKGIRLSVNFYTNVEIQQSIKQLRHI
jgi:hypothetical protein